MTSFFPGGPTKSVVRFNTAGGNDSLQLQSTNTVSLFGGGTDWTTFVVFAKNSPNTSGFGLIGSAGNPSIGIGLGSRNDTSLTITYSGVGDSATAVYHDGSTKIYDVVAWTHDNTAQVDKAYQNSNLVATETGYPVTSPNVTNALVLGTFEGQPGYLNGDIAEIIVYNQKLNSSDFTLVNDYLTAKWLPEPGSLGVLVIGAMVLVRRRVVRA